MQVHVLSDSIVKLSHIRGVLGDSCEVTAELLNNPKMRSLRYDAVIAAIDIRRPESIVALKEISDDLACVPKRVFLLIGGRARSRQAREEQKPRRDHPDPRPPFARRPHGVSFSCGHGEP